MSEDLRNLIIEQSATIASMKRVLVNFKKLGKVNITSYKAKNRLDHIETLWSECRRLNVWLLQVATLDEQRSFNYFTAEEFYAAEDVYNEAADYLAEIIGFSHGNVNPALSVSDVSLRDSSAVTLQLPRISLPKFSEFYRMGEFSRNIRIVSRF